MLTVGEASARLNISPSQMRTLIRAGKITAYRLSPKCVRLTLEDLERYTQSCRSSAPPAPKQRKVITKAPALPEDAAGNALAAIMQRARNGGRRCRSPQ